MSNDYISLNTDNKLMDKSVSATKEQSEQLALKVIQEMAFSSRTMIHAIVLNDTFIAVHDQKDTSCILGPTIHCIEAKLPLKLLYVASDIHTKELEGKIESVFGMVKE